MKDQITEKALLLLKSNIISPADPDNKLNWSERKGPSGKKIENLLVPPEAGDFITPNKNTFVGQWYWDTMGTNVGLLRSNDDQLKKVALSMVRNLFMLYEKTGLIPNAADSVQNTRSQPPFLSSMCLDIAEHYFNPAETSELTNWYLSAYDYCKRELEFPWEAHKTDQGFCWFDDIGDPGSIYSEEETLSFFRPESRSDFRILRSIVHKKLFIDLEEELKRGFKETEAIILKALGQLKKDQRKELCKWLYSRRLLVCSGMDFTASYGLKELPSSLTEILEPSMLSASDKVYSTIEEVSPLDLNCLILKYYRDLRFIAGEILKFEQPFNKAYLKAEIQKWEDKIASQRDLIYNTHFSEKHSCFFNFNRETNEKMINNSHLTQYAYPLFAHLTDSKGATELVKRIRSLITEYGLKSTVKKTGFQWDFNMWPLQTWICFQGLKNYGFHEEAKKIANGYMRCAKKVYQSENSFFEKYNAESGTVNTDGRYRSEPEFSWGAAVYVALRQEGERGDRPWTMEGGGKR